MTDDIFGYDDPHDLPRRDRWQRPLLLPAGQTERQAYTRASSLSDMVSDSTSLGIWAQNQVVIGMAQRPDLVALAGTLPPLWDEMLHKSRLTPQQLKRDRETKAALKEIREVAREQAKMTFKARIGTAIHSLCEPGADRTYAGELERDAASFTERLERDGISIYTHETFVASDDLMCAGSFDYLVHVPGLGPVILDIKTGSVDPADSLKFAVQLAVYANSEVYDVFTDERAPLESLTDGLEVNRKAGVIAHVAQGTGKTDLYTIDLDYGLRGAKLATMVRTARQVRSAMTPLTLAPVKVAS